jgi:hypothetical protein
MDNAVIKYYKMLLKTGFERAGTLDNPSIVPEYDKTKGALCGKTGDSLRLYINIYDDMIDDIKYLCTHGECSNRGPLHTSQRQIFD